MREIKFRDFDFETKELRYFNLDSYDRYTHDQYGNVMQFTGLQDKNGKGNDVYEGDNFELVFSDCPDWYTPLVGQKKVLRIKGTVVFKFGKFMIEFMHPEENCLVYSDLYDFLRDEEKEIIGNIHLNPELLNN